MRGIWGKGSSSVTLPWMPTCTSLATLDSVRMQSPNRQANKQIAGWRACVKWRVKSGYDVIGKQTRKIVMVSCLVRLKYQILKSKSITSIWFYISNVDTGAFIKHLLSYRREYCGNLIEPVPAEAYGVGLLTCLPKLIWHIWHFQSSQKLALFKVAYSRSLIIIYFTLLQYSLLCCKLCLINAPVSKLVT